VRSRVPPDRYLSRFRTGLALDLLDLWRRGRALVVERAMRQGVLKLRPTQGLAGATGQTPRGAIESL
jgi:hypothetical protein